MKIQIKNRWNHSVLFETDAENIGAAIVAALAARANLRSADLRSANLRSANLSGANLSGADLRSADLRSADLSGADLSGADLRSANLRSADLSGADLRSADLRSANLRSANLSGANLSGADLSGADLSGANLRSADLRSADLRSADLSGADLKTLVSQRTILPDGDLIGWKKLSNGVICKLKIPSNSARVGGLIGRKCRAEFAEVLEGCGNSIHDSSFTYRVGDVVSPDKFDPNPIKECSSGIHFFITRQEAEDYQ